ncbi:MAG TPA: helix-turn-helix domain-containing protein [Clostridia bacterium]|nr:helix-turn-helix domain-containing protein [Clostridia bacterium]
MGAVKAESKHICPIEYTLDSIGGKWKLLILYYLMIGGVKRYGELKRSITGITHKMLSQQLKDLEADSIILRKEYHQIPPKVEYTLSEKGVTLLPILKLMYDWGSENLKKCGIPFEDKLACLTSGDRRESLSVKA